MEEVFFSVIVPVYNTERYLNKCLNSILGQTFWNMEIIAVDDGSTDSCPAVLDDFASRDGRLKVIHKSNGGIGSACAKGLEMARGSYLVFVDSDDYIEPQMLQVVYDTLQETDADIVHFGLRMVDERGDCISSEIPETVKLEDRQSVMTAYFTKLRSPSLACRVFRKKLYDGVEFIQQSVGIDEATILQVLSKCEKYVSLEKIFYNVFVRAGSVSRSVYTTQKIGENLWLYDYMLKYTEKKIPEYKNFVLIKYMKLIMTMYRSCEDDVLREKKETLLQEFKECDSALKSTTEWKQETQRFRTAAGIFRISADFYRKIKHERK